MSRFILKFLSIESQSSALSLNAQLSFSPFQISSAVQHGKLLSAALPLTVKQAQNFDHEHCVLPLTM